MKPLPWPWPQATQGLAQQTRALLDASAGLSVTGWEASCKFSPAGLETGRLLLGFSPAGVADRRLRELPHDLGMPAAAAADFLLRLGASSQVMLAVEQGRQQGVAKAYLEFPMSAAAREAGATASGFLHLIGYKWPILQSPAAGGLPPLRVTQYRWSPDQARAQLVLAAHVEAAGSAQPSACGLLVQALEWSHRHAPGQGAALVLAVNDTASPRLSWAVKFHGSGLRAALLRQGLARLTASWGLNARDVAAVIDTIADRDLGWLAAGAGSDGLPFFTLYAVAHRTDAQQACFAYTEALRVAPPSISLIAGPST
jgi:hypothetical protein